MSLEYWICAGITLVSAAVSFGFSVAALRGSTGDARTALLYALARSLALLIVAVIALLTGSVPFVAAVASTMIIVQTIDAGIGAILRNQTKTVGPALTALVNLATLIWLLLS